MAPNKKSAAKSETKIKGSGYVATRAFTQFESDGAQTDYKAGDEIPENVHPNRIGKYISGGFVAEKPAEKPE
jgi:hypothetical protein